MKGDYFRRLAEFSTEEERKEATRNALEFYNKASKLSMIELPPTHPVRLDLALNFSTFQNEILKQPDKAATLAKEAFNDAIAELDSFKSNTPIMKSIKQSLIFANGVHDSSQKKSKSKKG
eukprot:CAMPEP_0174255870 /NCGR_PEP_ID=MMETSP0439-20130205/5160_1 /TAXON_ID=0 /ORGANISM="Stereomyxa ramosa, Strain Chinc5" /LENGTH=119 /DNA_ID=CAMNT_0015338239 /DNA_START=663 /DNA_END=1022 /DNA_ORIENTATION=-